MKRSRRIDRSWDAGCPPPWIPGIPSPSRDRPKLTADCRSPIPYHGSGVDLARPSGIRSAIVRALIGLALIPSGLGLRRIGIRGLAGSLVILDPPRAKEDLEPWSRAAGGLVDAALSEVDLAREAAGRLAAKAEVRVRCPGCGALNDEKARFCDQCGKPLGPGGEKAGQEEDR
jgi:hypothetical protein